MGVVIIVMLIVFIILILLLLFIIFREAICWCFKMNARLDELMNINRKMDILINLLSINKESDKKIVSRTIETSQNNIK